MAVQLRRAPVELELGGRKFTLRFNLNAALLIREAGKDGADVWQQVGERPAEDGGAPEKLFRVDYDNLRVYLWAMLQRGTKLTLDEVGDLLDERDAVLAAAKAVGLEISRWYGVPLGENETPAAS